MINLLKKELRLCLNIQSVIFVLICPVMMLIPNYPRYVGFFYICLAVFLIFTWGMTNNDITYTSLLPVTRADIVKARFLLVGLMEFASIVLCVPFSLIYSNVFHMTNTAGINSSVAFYGLSFVLFSVFNFIFLTMCYKKINKPGIPFLVSAIAFWVFYMILEIPVWGKMNIGNFISSLALSDQIRQLPILFAGIAVWILVLFGTFKICVKEFKKVNL